MKKIDISINIQRCQLVFNFLKKRLQISKLYNIISSFFAYGYSTRTLYKLHMHVHKIIDILCAKNSPGTRERVEV